MPGNQTIGIYPVVNGELRSPNGTRGVQLDSRPGSNVVYVMNFDVFSVGGASVGVNPIPIHAAIADNSTADVAAISFNAHQNYHQRKN